MIFTLILASLSGFSQSGKKAIADIRKRVEQIDGDSALQKIEIPESLIEKKEGQLPDGGESVTGYVKAGGICKISQRVGLSVCVRLFDYYFNQKGQVIAVLETEKDYPEKKNGELDYNKLKDAFFGRYYMVGNKVIAVKATGKKRQDEMPSKMYVLVLVKNVSPYTAMIGRQAQKIK